MKINYYTNTYDITVQGTVEIEQFLNKIKSPKQEIIEKISYLRTLDRNSIKYKTKKKELPCVTCQFLFNKTKKNANIIAPTGFLFYDLDLNGDINPTKEFLIKNKYVYAVWLSPSGKGLHCLVRAEYTVDTFKQVYISFAQEFNLPYDDRAIRHSQYTYVSIDNNIYVNTNCNVFSYNISNNINNNIYRNYNVPSSTPYKTSKDGMQVTTMYQYDKNDAKLDAGNYNVPTQATAGNYNVPLTGYKLDDLHKIRSYERIEEKNGVEYTQVNFPKVIKNGSRNVIMSTSVLKFAHINNLDIETSFETLMSFAYIINSNCQEELSHKEIVQIVNSVIKNYNPEIIKKKKKKIVFEIDCPLSKSEKQSYASKKCAEWKRENTLKRLQETFDYIMIEGNMPTQSKVAEIGDMHINTVKKYWKQIIK